MTPNANAGHTVGPRIGIDLGGTKIAAVALAPNGDVVAQERVETPRGDYDSTVRSIGDLVDAMESRSGAKARVGVGIPGSISPTSGRVQNANSRWLNGRKFREDLETVLARPVRLANDANCFALSEASDGAAAGQDLVFGVILGTGCGGGLVYRAQVIDGPRGITGEWGHTPLPNPGKDELPGPACWCGRSGCMETWVSGPAMAADHERNFGELLDARKIAECAGTGCKKCQQTLQRHASRLARGLAGVMNILDPSCIVLGGGLSNMAHLYEQLPRLIAPYIFSDDQTVTVLPPRHGPESGARGAAWLWS